MNSSYEISHIFALTEMGNKISTCLNIDNDIERIMQIEKAPPSKSHGSMYDGQKLLFSEWWTFYFYGDNANSPYGMINYITFRISKDLCVFVMYPAIMIPSEFKRFTSVDIQKIEPSNIGIGETNLSHGKCSISMIDESYYIRGESDKISWNFIATNNGSKKEFLIADNIDLLADQKLTYISQLPRGKCSGSLSYDGNLHRIDMSKCEIEHLYGNLLLDSLKWTMCLGYDEKTSLMFYLLDTPEKGAFMVHTPKSSFRITSETYRKEITMHPDADYPASIILKGIDPIFGIFNIKIETIGISASEMGSAAELLAWVTIYSSTNLFREFSITNSISFTGMFEYYRSGLENIFTRIYDSARKLL